MSTEQAVKLILGVPTYSGILDHHALLAIQQLSEDFPGFTLSFAISSGLIFNFNQLWSECLNARAAGLTHFLMLHDDIVPCEEHWGKKLMDEMDSHDLDVISANIPIKHQDGDSSTALDTPTGVWRVPMGKYKSTVTSRDEPQLLINTGLMIMRVQTDWAEDFHFFDHQNIVKQPDGTFACEWLAEDWIMSRWLRARNVAFGCTNIRATHRGTWTWNTWSPDPIRDITKHGCWTGTDTTDHKFDLSLAESLAKFLGPQGCVVDFGCGTGQYVQYLQSRGIPCIGYDGNPDTPQFDKSLRILDLAVRQDLGRWDWVICLEVAEHIPSLYEDVLLDNLHRHNQRGMILSWGQPGQEGKGHVNIRPLDYVIKKVCELGYTFDQEASRKLRDDAVLPWFKTNLCVFHKAATDVSVRS